MKRIVRHFSWAVDMLRKVGLRPTSQRIGLVKLLFAESKRHVTAEELFKEAKAKGLDVSLATVYNTLNQFKDAGLLKELISGGERAFYDTNIVPHFHLFYENEGRIEDLPPEAVSISIDPDFLENNNVQAVDLVLRV